MSPQVEALAGIVQQAKEGNAAALDIVRAILKRAMEVCPDRDLLMIADALVELSPKLSAAATNGEKE